MRVVFIENRQQTEFWEVVARHLELAGHEVHYIVQNHTFAPRSGRVHKIPYPKSFDREASPEWKEIASRDRGVLYFEGDAAHYGYYAAAIGKLLEDIKPDAVFGECTLFHELLAIEWCRSNRVHYLMPQMTRYPVGRFFFSKYNGLERFGGSGETLSADEAIQIAREVTEGRSQALYLGSRKKRPVRDRAESAKAAAHVLWAWLQGERFNTPSPIVKLRLDRAAAATRKRWAAIARFSTPLPFKTRVLFAMQMQPETNLDVWGRQYRDQTNLIADLLAVTDEETVLIVKPNPYAKYEMTDDLVDLAASSPRIIPLPFRSRMRGIMATADLLVSVTGTASIEAFFAGVPQAVLVRGLVDDASPRARYIDGLSRLPEFIASVRQGTLPETSDQARVDWLRSVTAQSYVGEISNPLTTPGIARPGNVDDVSRAFEHVLALVRDSIASGKRDLVPPSAPKDRHVAHL